jgi:hypothetical protein
MNLTRPIRARRARRRAVRVTLFALACLLTVAGSTFKPAAQAGTAAAPTQEVTKGRVAKRRAPQADTPQQQTVAPAKSAKLVADTAADAVTPASTSCPNKTPISPNTTVNGTLDTSDCPLGDGTFFEEWTFFANAGQTVSVAMNSNTFDTYLFLLKPSETAPTPSSFQNDDGGTGGPGGNKLNSRIPPGSGTITLPETGTYSILANAISNLTLNLPTTGPYTLTLTFGGTGGTICPPNPTAISNGQTVNGALDANDCQLASDGSLYEAYSFTGTANQQVSITMTKTNAGDSLDPFLELIPPGGTIANEDFIATDDNSAGAPNAHIPSNTTNGFAVLPATGTYIILANSALAGQTGAYSLTLSIAGLNCPSTAINIGQTVNGTLATSDCRLPADGSFLDQYTFSGTQGQQIAITMTSAAPAGVDPFLFLFSAQGVDLIDDDNSGGGTAARIPGPTGFFTLPATGTYTIYANSAQASQTGGYTLSLTSSSATLPAVQFSAATFTVGENTPGPGAGAIPITSAVVTVTRSGDTTSASTVEYSTVDNPAAVPCDPTSTAERGIAYARCDYATTIDTLTFTAGETSKTFAVPLINDVHVEGPETFQVRLANPVGATLGTQATATVTITDDDGGTPTTNPINNSAFFVRMQYLDFLSREPDQSGFNAWLNVLNNCPNVNNVDPNSPSAGCDRIIVSQSFFGSTEFQLKGLYVFRFYAAAFGRLPTYDEIVPDMRAVTGQTSQEVFQKKAAFANAFTQRAEFVSKFGAQSNSAYVAALLAPYNLTQITTPNPATPDDTTNKVTLTQTDLVNGLNAATLTRAQVLRAVADSDQVGAAEFNRAFVLMQYVGYLRRTPDQAGFNAWLNYLNTHPTDFRTMVNGFMNSREYRLRFGPNTEQ